MLGKSPMETPVHSNLAALFLASVTLWAAVGVWSP